MSTRRATCRVRARTTPHALAIIKRAAEIKGLSLSEFIAEAADEAAHRTIAERTLVEAAMEHHRAFTAALSRQ